MCAHVCACTCAHSTSILFAGYKIVEALHKTVHVFNKENQVELL